MKLLEKIKVKEAKIVVIGLEYVGLPLAVEKAKAGFNAIGLDHNPERVAKVNRGESYILSGELAEEVQDGSGSFL